MQKLDINNLTKRQVLGIFLGIMYLFWLVIVLGTINGINDNSQNKNNSTISSSNPISQSLIEETKPPIITNKQTTIKAKQSKVVMK